jgi:hypothetical protein
MPTWLTLARSRTARSTASTSRDPEPHLRRRGGRAARRLDPAATPAPCHRLFGATFGRSHTEVQAHGSVLAAMACLRGLAWQELPRSRMDYDDPSFPVIVTVRARRWPRRSRRTRGSPARRTTCRSSSLPGTACGSSRHRPVGTRWRDLPSRDRRRRPERDTEPRVSALERVVNVHSHSAVSAEQATSGRRRPTRHHGLPRRHARRPRVARSDRCVAAAARAGLGRHRPGPGRRCGAHRSCSDVRAGGHHPARVLREVLRDVLHTRKMAISRELLERTVSSTRASAPAAASPRPRTMTSDTGSSHTESPMRRMRPFSTGRGVLGRSTSACARPTGSGRRVFNTKHAAGGNRFMVRRTAWHLAHYLRRLPSRFKREPLRARGDVAFLAGMIVGWGPLGSDLRRQRRAAGAVAGR